MSVSPKTFNTQNSSLEDEDMGDCIDPVSWTEEEKE
jgi:hypothetical protein